MAVTDLYRGGTLRWESALTPWVRSSGKGRKESDGDTWFSPIWDNEPPFKRKYLGNEEIGYLLCRQQKCVLEPNIVSWLSVVITKGVMQMDEAQ